MKNKVVLVSGSSMGIGKAIAMELAQRGARIMLNGRESEKLHATEAQLSKMGYVVGALVADIRDPSQCQNLIDATMETFGKLDIVINNAALSSRGSIENTVISNFPVLMETNFTGAAYLSKYAIPYLKETRGHLIFINSAGGFRGMPYNSFYTASKMAQAALAEALRIELHDYGIHVGVAYVGFTENDPKKAILDVDGNWVYLPKRNNIRLAKPQSVARSICLMIEKRKNKITLTRLGLLSSFITRYLPRFGEWILRTNRDKIEKEFTYIGGEKVAEGPS